MGMCLLCATEADFERLIDAVNAELEQGDWFQVRLLVRSLYAYAVLCGDGMLAELLEDLYWIAGDALAFPVLAVTRERGREGNEVP
jgi:hypothetical protein